MLYIIPNTLLKVSLNTNKIGHHVIRYTRHIVESVVKQHGEQFYWCLTTLSTMRQV
jgi:hypothetical protein